LDRLPKGADALHQLIGNGMILLGRALSARHLGVKCLIVPPIRDKKNAFFRFKRWLEKPTVKKFKKRNGIEW